MKISRSVTKIDSLDSQFGNTSMSIAELKALIADQQEQVRELRRLLLERSQQGPAPSIIVNQTIPKQKPATIVKMEKSEVNVKSNKWNDYSYTLPSAQEQAPIVAKQQETVVIEQVYSPPPKPKVVPKEIVPTPAAVVSAPAQKPQAAAETPVARPPSPKEMKLDTPPTPLEAPEPKDPNRLYIDFSAKFNKDLRILSLEKFTVGLELDWNADDTVLEIRKELSRQAKVPYSCAALTMDGQLVKLAMDLDPQLPFSPEDVKEYAELGRLGVKVNRMNVVSNPQIDLFVPAWERSAGVANSSELGKFAKTRRSYPEEELFESDSKDNRKKAKPAMYSTVRTSLDKLMVSVQDKAGLTDDELERKVSLLHLHRIFVIVS